LDDAVRRRLWHRLDGCRYRDCRSGTDSGLADAWILFAGCDRRSHRRRLAGVAVQATLPEPVSSSPASRSLWIRRRPRRFSLWFGTGTLVYRFMLGRDVIPNALA